MPLTVGQVLQNRYRVVTLLGQGGMGAVYRAWDLRLKGNVALKEMTAPPGLDTATLDQLRQQFEQEAVILAKLNHPNLVRVIDFFEEGDSAYLVMDLVEGESLDDCIAREGALPENTVLAWAAQLLDALHYCHSQGVIHRDIKPQNVIVRPDGRAMLVDFGLLKLWNPTDPRTQTVMRGMGSPEYAPPEQYGTRGQHTDPRSDLYSLGATLYHALTGQAPPTANDRMADPGLYIPLRRVNPRVSTQTEAAVQKAMELPRDQRFASAQQMAAALAGAPVVAAKEKRTTDLPPVTECADKQIPSPKVAIPAWAWVAFLVAILLFGGLWSASRSGTTPATVPVRTSMPTTVPTRTPTVPPTPTPQLPVLVGTVVPQPRGTIGLENAAGVTQLARWGKGSVEYLAYSPDGNILAAASSLGIYLYSADTLEELRLIETNAVVRGVAFAPDGQTLASWAWDGTARVWQISDGTMLRTIEVGNSVAFAPDLSMLASGLGDGTVQLRRMSDGVLLRTLEGHTENMRCFAFAPDGSMLASGSWDGTVRLWRVSDGTLLRTIKDMYNVYNLIFAPDGDTLASISWGDGVQLWRVSDGALLYTLEGGEGSVAFAPDGNTLAFGVDDGTIRLWRASDGRLLRTLEGHKRWVRSVVFAPDGHTLASTGAGDKTVRLWQVSDGALLHALEMQPNSVYSVEFSPDGHTLASGTWSSKVQLWRVSDGALLRTLEGHTEWYVHSVAYAPDGSMLASGGEDGTVRLWRASDGTLLRIIEGHTGSVNSVTFAPDGNTLVSGADDNTVRLWRASDGTLLRIIEGHTGGVNSVAFAPDGNTLVSGSHDNTVRLWRVSDGALLHVLEGHTEWIESVAFAPDGSMFASGSWDGTVRLWRVSDGALLRTLGTGSVWSVTFTPDGSILASGSPDNAIRLWRVSDGALLRTLVGHNETVTSLVFAPDGSMLASGSVDDTVRLWGVPPQ